MFPIRSSVNLKILILTIALSGLFISIEATNFYYTNYTGDLSRGIKRRIIKVNSKTKKETREFLDGLRKKVSYEEDGCT
ncbi:hypothetical protein [Leptospira weilii]|uniref:hypothetical protein n=1 Tax=Leptospira weilii TaxID=28184 RepID=UPI0002C01A03|nr:hypothetical protein [Leptospira weilii]EMN45141.1 hypothetical protein LEP1GSC086_1256 [Leptospira weilii str. LNT 1234]QDK23155.1 hypothetical protein FHG67_10825 [Leptospira weilii]QDK27206.1 hypothetical protein FHG68_11425 [Leptospira weilii]